MNTIKKLLLFWLVGLVLLSLISCTNKNKESTENAIDKIDQRDESTTMLADSLTITEATLGQIQLAYNKNTITSLTDYKINEDTVNLTFSTKNASLDEIKLIIDEVLMKISANTVNSKIVIGGYATVYDHYTIFIIVKDSNQNELFYGEMPAKSQSINWIIN